VINADVTRHPMPQPNPASFAFGAKTGKFIAEQGAAGKCNPFEGEALEEQHGATEERTKWNVGQGLDPQHDPVRGQMQIRQRETAGLFANLDVRPQERPERPVHPPQGGVKQPQQGENRPPMGENRPPQGGENRPPMGENRPPQGGENRPTQGGENRPPQGRPQHGGGRGA